MNCQKVTLITHIYNEEYLLPFWLNHHKSMFDDLIIVDYESTDSSLDICKSIWPNCKIIGTINRYFDAHKVDAEIMDIEKDINGIKLVLNTTEFLFTHLPIKDIFKKYGAVNTCLAVNTITPYYTNPIYPNDMNNLIDILLKPEIRYIQNDRFGISAFRFLHNYVTGAYDVGRHNTGHTYTVTNDLQLMWLGFFPWNEHIKKRKLQIKDNMTQKDKEMKLGYQHLFTLEQMEELLHTKYSQGRQLKDINIHLYNMISKVRYKKHYRGIILVLSSNFKRDTMYREIWKKYMFIDPQIKVIFIYGKSDNILSDYNEDYDIISDSIPESLGIKKVLEAFRIIEDRYTYDYLIRTNLSTFWDFNKLHRHLDVLPAQNCYSGDGPLPDYDEGGYYLSGVDTIVTPDMITSINNNKHLVHVERACEDQSMGLYFNGILGVEMLPTRICFFEDIKDVNQVDEIRNRIHKSLEYGITHYRVKNTYGNREELDRCVYKELMNSIYNIELI
jgi:hypothetical protein